MILFLIFILGLMVGSFLNAFVWRAHEKLNKKSKYKAADLSIVKGRSMCVSCGHTLAWYDLIPVFSWLTLRGKCRYCEKPISWQYPAVEIIFALALAASFNFWPFEFTSALDYLLFAIWGFILIYMAALVIYDLNWLELPTDWVYVVDVASLVFVGLSLVNGQELSVLRDSAIGALILGGLFWGLYQVSKGAWIGGGDVRLGFAIGILLGWAKAILALSLAAYIGTIMIVIAIALGKYKKRMKLPFGPLLIAGWYISLLWGQTVIDWYMRLIGAA